MEILPGQALVKLNLNVFIDVRNMLLNDMKALNVFKLNILCINL